MRASARLALCAIQLACAAVTGGSAGCDVLRVGSALPLGSGFTLTPDGGCTTCADCPAELEAKAPAAARAVLTLTTNGAALGYRFTEDFQTDVSAGQIPREKPLPRRCHPLTPGCFCVPGGRGGGGRAEPRVGGGHHPVALPADDRRRHLRHPPGLLRRLRRENLAHAAIPSRKSRQRFGFGRAVDSAGWDELTPLLRRLPAENGLPVAPVGKHAKELPFKRRETLKLPCMFS